MMRRWGPATLLLASALTSSAAPDRQKFCFDACRGTLTAVRFSFPQNDTNVFMNECVNHLLLESLYLCADTRCSTSSRDAGVESFKEGCQELGVSVPGLEAIEKYTEEELSNLLVFNATIPGREQALTSPALPTVAYLNLWMGTAEASVYVHYYHVTYGWAMGYFWLAVVAVGMITRFMAYLDKRRMHLSSKEAPIWTWFKCRIKVPATLGHRCAQDYGGWATVPPLIQTLTIGAFATLNLFCSIHGYRFFPGNIFYPEVSRQVLRYVSDRTGIISFANFPLIWLFGMRNNLVLWLTGWDFGTFNNFHRWVARIATLQAVVHSIGYTVLILQEGGWTYFLYWWTLWFWWAGVLATIFMCAVLGFSFYWFRRSQYELFLLIHIALSVLVLFTMLGHVSIFNGRYDSLVWVPAFIWAADRVIRTARVFAFNWKIWNTQGQATFDAASNMIRLEVPLASALYRVTPGTFFYLMTDNTFFWESHPFTVASISNPESQSESDNDGDSFGEASPLLEADGHSLYGPERKSPTGSMTFLIRPYDSFTARLRERAEAQWPKPAAVRMAVDGPYGRTLALGLFSHVVFVVGGSGIVVPLSYMRTLLASTQCRRIEIHWAVREYGLAEELTRKDFRAALGSDKLSMDVYLTGDSGPAEHEGREDVRWHKRRLDATTTIAAAEQSQSEHHSSLAIVACGPARMADDARHASVDAMRRAGTRKRIDYFEESFQW